MRGRIALTTLLILLSTAFCHAQTHTQAEADAIIIILIFVVIVLLVLGGFGIYYNRIISQRNEQLRRILNALDDYRAIVGDRQLTLDEQEEMVTKKQPKPKLPPRAKLKFLKRPPKLNPLKKRMSTT